MSSPELRAAVAAAGVEATEFAAGLLSVAGDYSRLHRDPRSYVYGALAGSLRRDEVGVDPLLIAAVITASEQRADAFASVCRDLLDARNLISAALADEVVRAWGLAATQLETFNAELDEL